MCGGTYLVPKILYYVTASLDVQQCPTTISNRAYLGICWHVIDINTHSIRAYVWTFHSHLPTHPHVGSSAAALPPQAHSYIITTYIYIYRIHIEVATYIHTQTILDIHSGAILVLSPCSWTLPGSLEWPWPRPGLGPWGGLGPFPCGPWPPSVPGHDALPDRSLDWCWVA